MKKLILTCFLIIAGLNISIAQRFKASDFANIGIEHNNLMNVAYNTILSQKLNNQNKSDLIPVLQNSLQSMKGYSQLDIDLGFKNLSNLGKEVINIDSNFYTFTNSSKIDRNTIPYLDKLYLIVMTENITSEDLTIAVENLETEIYNDKNINNNQLLIFYSGSNVAKYSNLYWEENITNWVALNPKSQFAGKQKGRRIVGADVAGGVAGAVGAAIVNLAPGVGQVAYGSAIVAGAVGSSICEAGSQLMSWMGW